MTDQRGRCTNVEYCAVASAQRLVTLPEDVPFICPKCSEPLHALQTEQRAKRNRVVLLIQAAVILAGGGAVAYKLFNSSPPDHPAGDTSAAPITQAAQADPVTPAPAQAAIIAAPPHPAPIAAPPAANLLRLAGSNVIGGKLARRLASGYLALIGDSDITTEPTATAVSIIGNQAGEREAIGVAQAGTAAGFNALLRGTADIAMAVRPPTPAEIDKLASVADLTNPANEHVIAVDGVAAIVSPSNRTPSLTVGQLRSILAGTITSWDQLGGTAGPIHVVIQDDLAGTVDTAANSVLGGATPAPGLTRLTAEADIAAAVAGDRNAIGFVETGHEATARVLPIAFEGAAPLAPDELTISTEDYPLTRRLVFYTAPQAASTSTRRFTDYAASPAGQAAIEAAGFVPLTIRKVATAVPATASARFRALVTGATRVSIDFRFQPGSTALDSRSERDVDRLLAFLRAEHADGSRLILAGFADSQGTPGANQIVSQRRADAVVAALGRSGVTAGHVAVFGSELPVADNATSEGRERNRRVEVYLAQ